MGLSLAAMERMLKDAGAKRVGEDAKAALAAELERHGRKVASRAASLATHAKRRTVTASDVQMARE